jgi:predicted PurR-regulated permease PerM
MRSFPQPGAATLVAVILTTCLLLFLFQKAVWLVMPALIALMLYYCTRPAVKFLVFRGMSHEAAVYLVWFLLQLLSAVIVIKTIWFMLARSGTWENSFDNYILAGQNLINKTTAMLERMIPVLKSFGLSSQVNQQVHQITDNPQRRNLLPLTVVILKWVPCVLLVPYMTYFMLKDSGRLKKFIILSVPNAFFEKSLLLFSRLDVSLQNYFQGLLWLTFLDTICLAGGLKVLGIPNALWLGLISAVLAWIPYVGSIAACAMVVLVASADFPQTVRIAYACLILFLIVRVLDDFLFLPLTIGRKLHVHPVLSLLMLFLGGTVAGATGLVLALPLFGVVAVIGEAIAQIVTDDRLIARYRLAKQLAHEASRRSSTAHLTWHQP